MQFIIFCTNYNENSLYFEIHEFVGLERAKRKLVGSCDCLVAKSPGQLLCGRVGMSTWSQCSFACLLVLSSASREPSFRGVNSLVCYKSCMVSILYELNILSMSLVIFFMHSFNKIEQLMMCANKTHFLARKLHVGRDFPTSGEARANYFPPFFIVQNYFSLFLPKH